MSEMLPCPFCGTTPSPESNVHGTQYEIWCEDCGQAVVGIQISDLMTMDERLSDPFTNHRYRQEFIDRAREEAINRWNTRKV